MQTVFGLAGSFGVALVSYFIFQITSIPSQTHMGEVLIQNHSFENWDKVKLLDWEQEESTIFPDKTKPAHGSTSLHIVNNGTGRKGVMQQAKLDPNQLYHVYYSMKADTTQNVAVGIQITYEGHDIRNTADADPGETYYEGNTEWIQYFGRVSGAESVVFFFFADPGGELIVDEVGIGLNIMPSSLTDMVKERKANQR